MTTNSNGSKSAAGVDWIVDSPDVVHLEGRSQPRYMQHPWTERPIGPLTGLFGDATIISESEQNRSTKEERKAKPYFPHPTLGLPEPEMKFEFRMSVQLNPSVSLGESSTGGKQTWTTISGGTWSGTFGSGTVVPGGQDNRTYRPTSMTSTCKYLLQTTDTPPAFITVATRGQHNPCTKEVEALLSYPNRAGEICDSAAKLRFFVSMETGDARYAEKVNAGMWVGIGAMKGTNEIIYDAYRIC